MYFESTSARVNIHVPKYITVMYDDVNVIEYASRVSIITSSIIVKFRRKMNIWSI